MHDIPRRASQLVSVGVCRAGQGHTHWWFKLELRMQYEITSHVYKDVMLLYSYSCHAKTKMLQRSNRCVNANHINNLIWCGGLRRSMHHDIGDNRSVDRPLFLCMGWRCHDFVKFIFGSYVCSIIDSRFVCIARFQTYETAVSFFIH